MRSERFTGTVKGMKIIFEHDHFLHYRLSVNGTVTTGELNTERGFGSDENATLFILNPSAPEKEQKYFVRLSSGKIRMLDQHKKIIQDGQLKKIDMK